MPPLYRGTTDLSPGQVSSLDRVYDLLTGGDDPESPSLLQRPFKAWADRDRGDFIRKKQGESDFASPTHAAWMKMIGAKGVREKDGRWEAMIDGKWRKVDDPATYFRKKSKERWGDGMPEDKSDKGEKKEKGGKSEGPRNKKGGPMFAEDDFPIQGMNPTSAPMAPPPSPTSSAPPEGQPGPGMPPGGEDPLSGSKWAEPILKAIPGNRGDLMAKAMKLIGQLGEVLAEAGYTEGVQGDVTTASAPPGGGGAAAPPPPRGGAGATAPQ